MECSLHGHSAMTNETLRCRRWSLRRARGFTLIELMVTVIIVGVLAMLAVVGYRRLVTSARSTEAKQMVQSIRVAQEAYRAEVGTYADISTNLNAASGYPACGLGLPPAKFVTAWGGACTCCKAGRTWTSLPVHVDGPVMFGYATIAGAAGVAPGVAAINGYNVTFPVAANVTSPWFIVAASGNTDGDSAPTYCTVVGSSFTNDLWVDKEGE